MTFLPNRHEALWGSEDWLVSVHPSSPSIVADGIHAGKRLCDVAYDIPLLVKIIDAKSRLSVQVHPNDYTKLATGGDAKAEMWCALDYGFVYAGFRNGVTQKDIEEAIESGNFENLLVRHDLNPGDVIYVPGGLVHTIGEGTRIFEVQQSSDTTFRLFDWHRLGSDGKPRELHVRKAMRALDFSLPPPGKVAGVACAYFRFRRAPLDGILHLDGDGFNILYAFRGSFKLDGQDYPQGSCVYVAPGRDFTVKGAGAEVFVVQAGRT